MNAKVLFHLSPSSGVPIYRQLMDQVKTLLLAGRLKPDERLPPVRQVAQELEINPMTVSKAYSLLEKEGVLKRLKGLGMVVSSRRQTLPSVKHRQRELRALAEQFVAEGRQLFLSRGQVLEVLEPLLRGLKEEDGG